MSQLTNQQTAISVTGMTCAHCAARVQTAIRAVDGVTGVSVDHDAGLATVSGAFVLTSVLDAVVGAGYGVVAGDHKKHERFVPDGSPDAAPDITNQPAADGPQNTNLSVSGMSCASCVATVERAIRAVPGVTAVSVNFAGASASVTAEDIDPVIRAIERAGYDAHVAAIGVAEPGRELRANLLRSLVALLPATLLMGAMLMDALPHPGSNRLLWTAIGIGTFGAMWLGGGHFFRGALHALRQRTCTMDTLIALSTGTAWLFSMLVLLAPELMPAGVGHVFFEAALFVIGFVNLGKALEAHARGKTSEAISRLIERQPDTAIRVDGAGETEVAVSSLEPGATIRLRPGDIIPIDGVVVAGAGSVNEAMLTGESEPRYKQPGDRVTGGTANLSGALECRVTETGNNTVLARIIRRVTEAQNSKPAIGRLADQVSAYFVPLVLGIAALTVFVWGTVGPEPRLSYMLVTGMSVLIIACPCALGIATPMSIMMGIGRAALAGILIRNGDALQAAGRLTTIVLDKTGTLTKGEPVVTSFETCSGSPDDALAGALSLESLSEHPLAAAICDFARAQGAVTAEISEFAASAGQGVQGILAGELVACGNTTYLEALGFDVTAASGDVLLGRAGTIVASFRISDELRPEAAEAVNRMLSLGLEVVMLTGDNINNANAVARSLGPITVIASADPEQKLAEIKRRQAAGERVGMVGDGINDTLALSVADVGFAMGSGTAVALESADVALLGNRLGDITYAIALSRATMRNINQNLLAAFAYNTLLIPVAAGVLFPMTGVLIQPALAGLAMAASSVSVVTNSLRLRWQSIG